MTRRRKFFREMAFTLIYHDNFGGVRNPDNLSQTLLVGERKPNTYFGRNLNFDDGLFDLHNKYPA